MENKQDKRTLLMEKALEIYARSGALSIRALATASGMNVASVKYYFGNKQNLIDQIICTLIDSFQQLALRAEKAFEDPRERLHWLLCSACRRMIENPGIARLFYNLIGAADGSLIKYSQQAIGPQSPLYRICCNAISSEAGIEDKRELNCRFLIMISSIAPSFLIGLDPQTGNRFFAQRELSAAPFPPSTEAYIAVLIQTLLAPVQPKTIESNPS